MLLHWCIVLWLWRNISLQCVWVTNNSLISGQTFRLLSLKWNAFLLWLRVKEKHIFLQTRRFYSYIIIQQWNNASELLYDDFVLNCVILNFMLIMSIFIHTGLFIIKLFTTHFILVRVVLSIHCMKTWTHPGSLIHYRTSHTHSHTPWRKFIFKPPRRHFGCGRKPRNLEKTWTYMGRPQGKLCIDSNHSSRSNLGSWEAMWSCKIMIIILAVQP